MKKLSPQIIVFGSIFLLSLALRLWLLDKRWINPDEGAHLMDALLTLRGHIPDVDFSARQPFYVLVNAIWLKVFGVNYIAGRLLPMTCSLLTGGLIFLIARRLFNESVALLAAVIYLMMPLEIANSVVVKTEPLETLLACASILLLLEYGNDRQKSLLFISGALAALGYYVRQSALAVPVLGIYYIAINKEHSVTETIRSLAAYVIGYGFIVLAVLAFYAKFYTLEQIVFGGLDPAGFILHAGKKFWYLLFQQAGAHGTDTVNELIGTITKYSFHYLKMTVFLHSFLFAGIGWAAIRTIVSPGNRLQKETIPRGSYIFSLLWTGLLTAAYLYYYKVFGYYIDYFRDLLPVLSILFAAYVWETILQKDSQREISILIVLSTIALTALFFVENSYVDIPKGVQIVCVVAAVAVSMLGKTRLNRRTKLTTIACVITLALFYFLSRIIGLTPRIVFLVIATGGMIGTAMLFASNRLRFVNSSIVLSLMVLSTTYAGLIMGLSYESIWSNATVQKITNVLEENSSSDDEILSGAVIWEFNSHRRPFEMTSHPLVYSHDMSDDVAARMDRRLKEDPPKMVVLDGYTEKTYLQQLPWIPELLQQKYHLIFEDDGSKYPVRVYKLNKGE